MVLKNIRKFANVDFGKTAESGTLTNLLLAVVVLLTGTVHSGNSIAASCHENWRETDSTISGNFADLEKRTQIHLRKKQFIVEDWKKLSCYIRHDGGPDSQPLAGSEYAEFIGICRDPVTGFDWAIIQTFQGKYTDLTFWSVDARSGSIKLEYTEYWGGEFNRTELKKIVQDGECRVRARRHVLKLHLQAMSALSASDTKKPADTEEKNILDIEPDKSVILPIREVANGVVRRWLLALAAVRPKIARFEGPKYFDDGARKNWLIVQVLGMRLGNAPGVVLAYNRAKRKWTSLYDVVSGYSRRLNYPLRDMTLRRGSLFARACVDCSGWGYFDYFEIDLESGRATRLLEKPAFIQEADEDDTGNPPISNLEAEIGAI